MKQILKLEEFAEFVLGIFAFSYLDFAWWWFPALILTPDLGMIGYLVNPRFGAFTYNLVHHKATGIIVGVAGFLLNNQYLMLAGVILFSHSAMDRFFGYGLKYNDSFKHTHLGTIGK